MTAAHGYDVLAPVYDELGDAGAHARWLAAIERLAIEHGLRGRRVLDVACGTGSSFLPLLARGYEVTACDASPAMAACARAKAGPAARVHVADMRRLPRFGEFDLVTCLDDGLNHLAEPGDVLDALRGMRRNLVPGGLVGFDVALPAAVLRGGRRGARDRRLRRRPPRRRRAARASGRHGRARRRRLQQARRRRLRPAPDARAPSPLPAEPCRRAARRRQGCGS